MKQENTNHPLWRVLNEQRTQGKMDARDNGTLDIVFCGDNPKAIYPRQTLGVINHYGYDEKEAKATTQYTALAVNNLHILAEALGECLYTMSNWATQLGIDDERVKSMTQAKEALTRIS